MQKATKRAIGIGLISGVVGYILGRATAPARLPPAERVAPDVPPLQRMAGDIVYMCDQIRGPALELEAALADDREIDPGEAYALMQQVTRLAR
jgi:hypothetical protein